MINDFNNDIFNLILMQKKHWCEVKNIYEQGISEGNATFETVCPDWDTWANNHNPKFRIVALHNHIVAGWIALSPFSDRNVFSGVQEVSMYIANQYRGKGVGRLLLQKEIELSEKNNIWTLHSRIFPENKISINLHLKMGFSIVGMHKKIGLHKGIWRDIVLMDRRSETIG